jgi:DNA-binding XRE family transcriptional regulator
MTTAGLKLKDLRLNRGLSLRDAAKQIDASADEDVRVQEWTLRSAEQGRHIPQPRNAKAIADFYGVAFTDIWGSAAERADDSGE